MSKNNQVNLYQPRMLVAALNQVPDVRRFLMSKFFNKIKTHDTKTVDLDIRKGKRTVAAYVHPLSNGKVVERTGYETTTVQPAYMKELIPTRPDDTVTRLHGEDYASPLSPMQRAARLLGEDMLTLTERFSRREEVMAAQALVTGKVHVKGLGIDHIVDFGYEAGKHVKVLSGSSLWDSSGDPMRDLDNWARDISSRSGLRPNIAILGKNVIWSILDNPKVKERLDIRNYQVGQLGPILNEVPEEGVTYYGRLAPSNIELYGYDETWFNELTQKEEALIPDDGILLGNTNAGCIMHYGIIQNMFALGPMPNFPLSWVEDNGSARWLQLESAPMPNPYQVDAFMFAHVVSK